MKRLFFIAAAIVFAAVPAVSGYAQSETVTSPATVAGRIGASADWKVAKGVHVDFGYELRSDDDFDGVERHMLNLGVSYKVNDWLKVGGGYAFIGHFDGSGDLNPRHRIYVDGLGKYSSGDWDFSLKETLQLTNKSYDFNPYQETRNGLQLKSRIKAEYGGIKHVKPYALIELRNVFNDPSCSATYSTTSNAYANYEFNGYTSAYVNRFRAGLGVEWKVCKHNVIDFYCLGDWNHSKEIDTNASGTKLKSLTWENCFRFVPGISYQISF